MKSVKLPKSPKPPYISPKRKVLLGFRAQLESSQPKDYIAISNQIYYTPYHDLKRNLFNRTLRHLKKDLLSGNIESNDALLAWRTLEVAKRGGVYDMDLDELGKIEKTYKIPIKPTKSIPGSGVVIRSKLSPEDQAYHDYGVDVIKINNMTRKELLDYIIGDQSKIMEKIKDLKYELIHPLTLDEDIDNIKRDIERLGRKFDWISREKGTFENALDAGEIDDETLRKMAKEKAKNKIQAEREGASGGPIKKPDDDEDWINTT